MGTGHSKNADTYLDKDGTNEVSAATIKDAISKQLNKNSITGTFTTLDGKLITVVDGQITKIEEPV